MIKQNSKIIGILLGIVIAVVIAILGIVGYSVLKKPAEKSTEQIESKEVSKELSGTSGKSDSEVSNLEKPDGIVASSNQTKEKEYKEGYELIGKIEIPKTGLSCDILDETTKRALEIGVTKIYTASGLNKPGNTVIYGHNYRNALYFSKNNMLEIGDKIYITDANKNRITYEVYNIFETTSSDTSSYARSAEMTSGKCEILLSTCTDDASSTDRRLIVQARER